MTLDEDRIQVIEKLEARGDRVPTFETGRRCKLIHRGRWRRRDARGRPEEPFALFAQPTNGFAVLEIDDRNLTVHLVDAGDKELYTTTLKK